MVSACSSSDSENFLAEYDAYIRSQSRSALFSKRSIVHPDAFGMEADELAQRTRINVWQARLKQPLYNPKMYIRRTIHNEAVTMVRRYKPVVPLIINEEGELYQSDVLPMLWEKDPADIVEQKERARRRLQELINAVLTLPRIQQHAMFCCLKEKADDLVALRELCLEHNIDLDVFAWPTSADELQSMRTSASIAKKKLQKILQSA